MTIDYIKKVCKIYHAGLFDKWDVKKALYNKHEVEMQIKVNQYLIHINLMNAYKKYHEITKAKE